MSRPRLYPILDVGLLSARKCDLTFFAQELRAAGVPWLQYRNKLGSDPQMLADAAQLQSIFANTATQLIFNDRADLAVLAGFGGVHVGQQDAAPASARAFVGEQGLVGVSTHTLQQVAIADASDCNYIAYGPIFATSSKVNPDAVVGLEGLRAARRATKKHLVAIGGITRANCRAVMDAGADTIAVISDLFPRQNAPSIGAIQQIAEEFLALLA